MPNPESEALLARYKALADKEPRVTFIGRLGNYKYVNMDQVTASALATAENCLRKEHA